MWTDSWVIFLLISQILSVLLLGFGTLRAIETIRLWNAQATDARQLLLERRDSLISVLVKYILIFQIIGFFLFIYFINNYLPTLLSGAMCAYGTLDANFYGYPLLYTKIAALFIYLVFIFLNRLDSAEPSFPLMPEKYYYLLPAFAVLLADSYLFIQYINHVQPEIVTTCCSLSFSLAGQSQTDIFAADTSIMLGLFWGVAIILLILLLFYKKRFFIHLALSLIFIFLAVFVVKNHFVRFIYGIPSHACLFDMLFDEYNFVGYVLFGALFILLAITIYLFLIESYSSQLKKVFLRIRL